MSYQVHNFQPGAVLLASQLNEMDNQILNISEMENDGIFWCKYNVTTYSEIITALNNNQLPAILHDGIVFVLNRVNGNICYFDSVAFPTNRPSFSYIMVSDSQWAEATDPLQSRLSFDDIPTEGSTNPVTSSGIWTALQKAFSYSDEIITVDFTRFEKLRISLSATQKWNIAATETNVVRGYLVKIPDNAYECEVIGNNGPIAFLNSVNFSEIISANACDMSTLYPTRIAAFTGTRTYNLDYSTNYFYASAVSSAGVDLTPLSVVFRCKFKSDRPKIKQTIVNKDYTIDITTALALYNECVIEGKVEVEGSIYVPQNSTIRGKNADSKIVRRNVVLADTFYPVYVLNLQDETKVEGLTICGQPENITLTGSFGNVNGIGWVNPDNNSGVISKCNIKWCIGAGILLENQGTSSSKALIIDNCVITRCNYGICIYQNSEYNIISNCQITRNYYGYCNRGGNNKITNCGIDANKVGAQIDADYGANNGHGSISNCTFNHTDSGNGYGVVVKDTGRMVITGCNFYYSKLLLQNTDGNVISGCGFGNSSAIEISQGDCSLIVGSMFRDTSVTITRTNNTSSKIVNCYYRDGVIVS